MIDWAKLVAQGRAKAVGVSWSADELKAIYDLKIPAEYVRQGILTVEAYQEALNASPVQTKTKEEVLAEAKEEGIEATPDAPKEVLEDMVKKVKERKTSAPAKTSTKKTSGKK
ncbi:MAG: hypothetical protein PHQ35_11305 [Phycisphaerae bacterium]|nr:hypothetical protein [Phycisphaerae bacterium]